MCVRIADLNFKLIIYSIQQVHAAILHILWLNSRSLRRQETHHCLATAAAAAGDGRISLLFTSTSTFLLRWSVRLLLGFFFYLFLLLLQTSFRLHGFLLLASFRFFLEPFLVLRGQVLRKNRFRTWSSIGTHHRFYPAAAIVFH